MSYYPHIVLYSSFRTNSESQYLKIKIPLSYLCKNEHMCRLHKSSESLDVIYTENILLGQYCSNARTNTSPESNYLRSIRKTGVTLIRLDTFFRV